MKDITDTLFWAMGNDEFVPYKGKNPVAEEVVDLQLIQAFFDHDNTGYYPAQDRQLLRDLR